MTALASKVRPVAVLGASLLLWMVIAGCNNQPSTSPPPATTGGTTVGATDDTSAVTKRGGKSNGGTKRAPETVARFVESAEKSGLRFTYRDGQGPGHASIVESLGGGVGLLDFDGDGWTDIFLTGGGKFESPRTIAGEPGALFRALGPDQYAEVTTVAGVGESPYYSHGVAIADYDNDGFPDLLVTGYGGLRLFHNQGDGMFFESAQRAGLTDTSWSTSAGWGDLNGDGAADLYVVHYVNWSFDNDPVCLGSTPDERDICPPRKFEGLPDILYFSNGDGSFRDGSKEAGLRADGKGLGVVIGDLDLDGDLDIYVGNDTTPNFLYRNRGEGRFEETGEISGTALSDRASADGSMGVDIGDYNLDGLPDLWVANFENESIALYRNEGDCQFLHVSRSTGVTAVGGLFVSFGTLFFDLDRDGDEDVFVSNGHVIRYPTNSPVRQPPLLFENRRGRFENVAPAAGPYLAEPHLGRGVACGDLDQDGDLDLVLSPMNEPAALLRNETPTDNGWLCVRLVGVRSPRDAVGARLTLVTSAGKQTRQVKGGGSYLSHSELACHFGIPQAATVERLVIAWPSGLVQELAEIGINRRVTVIEPAVRKDP
ncbi:MAG: CRTAC1 family protein [Planctomycetales bacterium]